MQKFKQLLILMVTCCISTLAQADTPKQSLLCAITEVAECEILSGCIDVLPGQINLPPFITIDFKNQEVHGNGRKEKISTIESTEDGLILQGIGEQHRAWSLILNNKQTNLTGSITGHEYSFTIFAVCKADH